MKIISILRKLPNINIETTYFSIYITNYTATKSLFSCVHFKLSLRLFNPDSCEETLFYQS